MVNTRLVKWIFHDVYLKIQFIKNCTVGGGGGYSITYPDVPVHKVICGYISLELHQPILHVLCLKGLICYPCLEIMNIKYNKT